MAPHPSTSARALPLPRSSASQRCAIRHRLECRALASRPRTSSANLCRPEEAGTDLRSGRVKWASRPSPGRLHPARRRVTPSWRPRPSRSAAPPPPGKLRSRSADPQGSSCSRRSAVRGSSECASRTARAAVSRTTCRRAGSWLPGRSAGRSFATRSAKRASLSTPRDRRPRARRGGERGARILGRARRRRLTACHEHGRVRVQRIWTVPASAPPWPTSTPTPTSAGSRRSAGEVHDSSA